MRAFFKRCGHWSSLILGLAVLLLLTLPSYGQTPTLTLREALSRALDANPKLRGQYFAISAAAARVDQAALRPSLELGVDAENILGTNRLSTFDDTEITLRLGTVIELGDKRARRMEAAASERDVVLSQNDAERLDLLAEVARRFIRVAMLQEQYDLAARRLALASRTREGVDQRVNAARSPKLEGKNAAIAANRAQIEQSQAASLIRQAWAQLAAQWDNELTGTRRVTADLFAMPVIPDYAALAAMVERNPDILRFASERRVQDAKLRLAQSQRSPDITISAGVRRLQADRSNAFVVSASIPLGASARATPFISEAQSLREGVQYREQSARSELLATLFVALEQAKQSRSEVEALLSQAVPQAAEAQSLAEEGYRVGRFSLLELVTAQQQLTDVQRQAIDAAASFHTSLLEIERLIGRSAVDRDFPSDVGKP